jgi:hypothetical protein
MEEDASRREDDDEDDEWGSKESGGVDLLSGCSVGVSTPTPPGFSCYNGW